MELKMTNNAKLLLIKTVHTAVWAFFVTVIFYILYSGFFDRINGLTGVAIGLVVFEGGVLLLFKRHCPLTLIARKYSDSNQDNFDIFLPNWLAKYNKLIFTTLFVAGLLMVLLRRLL